MLVEHKQWRIKVRLLGAMTLAGGMVFTSCGMVDVRHNLVAGTMSFVKGYTADIWTAFLPSAEDLITTGPDED